MEPFEYFLVNYLKEHMHGTNIVGTTVPHLLMQLGTGMFFESIRELRSKWDSIIESDGLYAM